MPALWSGSLGVESPVSSTEAVILPQSSLHGTSRVCSHLLVLTRLPTRTGAAWGRVSSSPAASWEHPLPAPFSR